MRRIDALFADYRASHSTRGNRLCHAVGITLIVFGIFGFLARIPLAGIWTASELLIALTFAFYAFLDLPLALAVLVYAAILDVAARAVPWAVALAAFVVGWIFQAVGHAVYEKNRPAFFRNLVHLLIGPAFIVSEAVGLGPRPSDVSRTSS